MFTINKIQDLQKKHDAARAYLNVNRPKQESFPSPKAPVGTLNGNQINVERIGMLTGMSSSIAAAYTHVALHSDHPAIVEALKELLTITKLVVSDSPLVETANKVQNKYEVELRTWTQLVDAETQRYNAAYKEFKNRSLMLDDITWTTLVDILEDLHTTLKNKIPLNKWEQLLLQELKLYWNEQYYEDWSPEKIANAGTVRDIIDGGFETQTIYGIINRIPKLHRSWILDQVDELAVDKYLDSIIIEHGLEISGKQFVDLFSENGTDKHFDAVRSEHVALQFDTMMERARDLARSEIRANFLNGVTNYEEIYELRKAATE